MANVKISSLPAASAITGPELVPVVQGGVTKQATVAQVTATANANAAAAATAAASASVLAATKVSSVTASSPLSSTGGTAPNISLSGVVPVANGGTGITSLGAGVATWLGTPSSANLASAVTDETGSGSLVFNAAPTISSPTISSGDITFSGLAQRIAGDFSNTTVANRLMVQTTTTNGNTLVGVMPNGTGNVSHISFYSSTDTVNGSFTRMGATSATSESYIQAGRSGTGTYYPLTFYAGGSRRVDIDTSGNVGIGTASPGTVLHTVRTSAGAATVGAFIQNADNTTSTEVRLAFAANNSPLADNRYAWIGHVNTGSVNGGALTFATTPGGQAATERMRIDASGNVNISTAGARITGDFSNATQSNRLLFQTSTANSTTSVGAIPSGTGTQANIALYNGSDPTNSSVFIISSETAGVGINSNKTGTGSFLPITFSTNGSERLRILTTGGITSADLADAVGYKGTPLNEQSTAYTLVLGDQGKSIVHPITDNNARTFTIPANGSVAYPVGTTITFINMINTLTIAITTDTMYLAGAGTTGNRTLAAYGMATAVKMTSTTWLISGNGLT